MAVYANLLKDVLSLDPCSKVKLVDELLASLNQPDRAIDILWSKEVESRIDAYDRGEIESISVSEVMARYEKQ